jgi:hypothetical protein
MNSGGILLKPQPRNADRRGTRVAPTARDNMLI